jgi:orotidine-5'-phosphate decarboxylase
MSSPIILALDTKELTEAEKWIEISLPQIDHFKIGLEFFLKHGANAVASLRNKYKFNLFLDLKLYDIPNTVKGAVESVASLEPKFLTVHASGGSKMINVAASALPKGSITAVTVLTSFSEDEFASLGYQNGVEKSVELWAKQAIAAGATSIVCSPFEAKTIRSLSNDLVIITPGVRLPGDDVGDQSRVMTPKEAINNGANFVVIGRSITKESVNGSSAMQDKIKEIIESIQS